MIGLSDATLAQNRASDPASSSWVSANAGSGKTRVLTDRVARLLLAGCEPQKILCLTYTKAAAAEMQNRLFKRLGGWAMASDDTLREELAQLGEDAGLTPERLAEARRLFAKALETPGGLKIQTIHAFCDQLLRRFPLEAGVSPQFGVLDGAEARAMRAEILDAMAEGPSQGVIDGLAVWLTGAELDPFLQEIAAKRDILNLSATHQVLGRADGFDTGMIVAALLTDANRAALNAAATVIEAAKPSYDSARMRTILTSANHDTILRELETLLLFGAKTANPFGPKIDKISNKTVRAAQPEAFDRLNALAEQMPELRLRRLAARAVRKAEALATFADDYVARYDQAKLLTGRLDFDDLIQRANRLLSDSASAQWVLYKLDGGIDHILVDEAQDTSPEQWRIVARLAEEFTAGQGSHTGARTIFVVGDEKQSIYSFQGADPDEFGRMQADFDQKLMASGETLQKTGLLHSFRSAPAILRLVDQVFTGPAGDRMGDVLHKPFRTDMPGRVDVWPFLPKPDDSEEAPWYQPVNTPDPSDPRKTLAAQIAAWVRLQIDGGVELPGTGRAITAGDFLILVQTRGPLFHHILKALKARDVPVAGADRMKVAEQLAVRDILSLLRFADLPEDSLSLAEAMRSPLLGFTEDQLFRIAHYRRAGADLWPALRAMTDSFGPQIEMLQDVLQHADFLRPYELIERILTRHGGRERLLARLGPETEDAIDELLSQALTFERSQVPTLAGFLDWFAREDVEIKREMEPDAGLVRVMTVHGAKGLEAPIVLLPDTAERRPRPGGAQIVALPEGGFLWRESGADATDAQTAVTEDTRDAEQAERMRLLYVAMTRAERWLVVAGAGTMPKDATKCWYGLIDAAMGDKDGFVAAQDAVEPGIGQITTMRENWTPKPVQAAPEQATAMTTLPDWAGRPAPPIPEPPKPLSPSDLPGDKIVPGGEAGLAEDAAKRRGRQVHLLLEHLPGLARQDRAARAARVLVGADAADSAEATALVAEADVLLDDPALAWIFSADTLAEVAVTAEIPQLGARIDGIIDRLHVTSDTVTAVDFKTNAVVPGQAALVPDGILRQLGAYAVALQQIYPDREVKVGILWTGAATWMPVPHDIVMAALQSTAIS